MFRKVFIAVIIFSLQAEIINSDSNVECKKVSFFGNQNFIKHNERLRAKVCNTDLDCQHFGTCKNLTLDTEKHCECLKGTSGDFCEVVDKCKDEVDFCGEDSSIKCEFSLRERKAVCMCIEAAKKYDSSTKTCRKCDCGTRGIDCSYVQGQKVCTCQPGYFQGPNGQCRLECNIYKPCHNSGECINGVCLCKPGTSGFYCEDISCSNRGCKDGSVCVYDNGLGCRCSKTTDKYDYSLQKCRECFCGQHAKSCDFDFLNSYRKKCNCKNGYAQKGGICVPCDCGTHGYDCKYEKDETKKCTCDKGYANLNGLCVECNCGTPESTCTYQKGKKVCNCPKTLKDNNGICERCDCDVGGQDCNFNEMAVQNCSCKEGYEAKEGICVDIDECLKQSSCPQNTICTNTDGNYTCSCKSGFQAIDDEVNVRETGCIDINECEDDYEYDKTCPYTSQCINTPGSFVCVCSERYTPSIDSNGLAKDPRVSGCLEQQTDSWKTASIFFVALICLICLSGFIYIFFKRAQLNS